MFDDLPASYDDWKTAAPAVADPLPVDRCEFCSAPLYEGDQVYSIDGSISILVEPRCFKDYAKWALEAIRVEMSSNCECCGDHAAEGFLVKGEYICDSCFEDWAAFKLKAKLITIPEWEPDEEGDDF